MMWVGRFALGLVAVSIGTATFADDERDAQQAELDAQCQAAREAKLTPEREAAIDECVREEQKPDRETCERFYRDYGERSGHRAALYYDVPECVAATQFRRGASP